MANEARIEDLLLEDSEEGIEPVSDDKLTDRQIEKIFDAGRFQLHQDRNDFMLPQVEDFVETRQWINIRPEYQRRLRWDRTKKSKLIESLLMNVPVPAIFLYEKDVNRYEVMDGQQRINSIIEFYKNEFTLSGLRVWSALNGKSYTALPPRVRRGLDRAKLSAIILISDTQSSEDKGTRDIRSEVFERLNTGGEKLNPQELRNCVYSGPLNDLIVDLAGHRNFTDAWRIPPHEEHIRDDGFIGEALKKNSLYRTMGDCQIVLRFFAFRDAENVRGSVKAALDRCMVTYRDIGDERVDEFRTSFLEALELAIEVYGEDVFCLPPDERGRRRRSRPLYDAVMVGLYQLAENKNEIIAAKDQIKARTDEALASEMFYNIVVGRPNTADAILARISTVKELISGECG